MLIAASACNMSCFCALFCVIGELFVVNELEKFEHQPDAIYFTLDSSYRKLLLLSSVVSWLNSRMKPLSTSQRTLTWLCMFPPSGDASNCKRISYFILSVSVFATLAICLMSSVCYISKFISVDLKASLYAMSPAIACTGLLYVYIVAIFSQRSISALFKKLSAIYDACKYFCTFICCNSNVLFIFNGLFWISFMRRFIPISDTGQCPEWNDVAILFEIRFEWIHHQHIGSFNSFRMFLFDLERTIRCEIPVSPT